jgi:hypothetical protein
MLPTLRAREDRNYDVYFSGRDADGRARIGRRVLDGSTLQPIAGDAPALALDLGAPGTFDDAGCHPACVTADGEGNAFLYYTGWSLGRSVPFYFYIGAARIGADGGLHRISAAPVLDRSSVDPYLTASPWVLVDGGIWRMWYVSGVRWAHDAAGPKHYYHIRYAESTDGLQWTRRGVVCIDFANDEEYAIARPSVVRDGNTYKMWYTYRGASYRIGYAESGDGIEWVRRDDGDAVIAPSKEGWDSEMVTYPFVFDDPPRRLMLYNGNGYGRTGFGLAEWE